MSNNIKLGTIEAAIADLQAGKPVLVADSPQRENEADVIFAASNISVEWVAWTIRHSSGYLCAPLPPTRADYLDLPLMVTNSQDPRRTAYTITVDAAVGVTTGISAADRLRTLQVLADPDATSADLIRPGHIVPLRAIPGGVLHRPGHTEAAVDLIRLAGLGEVGGIAELVNDDGTMTRLAQASELAKKENLTLITIADLITWREKNDPLSNEHSQPSKHPRVQRMSSANLPTEFGEFTIIGYKDLITQDDHLVLQAKTPVKDQTPFVRIHSECLTGDAFGSLKCDCGPQLHEALHEISKHGGALIYVQGHEGRGIGIQAKIAAYNLQDQGRDTIEANLDLGLPVDRREYGAAAAILNDLELTNITLLSNNPAKFNGLQAHGVEVKETKLLQVGVNEKNIDYLTTKKESMGHLFQALQADLNRAQTHHDELEGSEK